LKKVSILGSTGSIGTQTLEVISQFPGKFEVTALGAGSNIELLKNQIEKFQPKIAVVKNEEYADKLLRNLGSRQTEIIYGEDGYNKIATLPDADIVISSMVGSSGLKPTYAAIEAGKTVGLANKESLVVAGQILTETAKKSGSQILPIDSEHSAIFQVLNGSPKSEVKNLIITASGGPFRETPPDELTNVTVESALNHPNWKMGNKITIDSSTLINKGFEVIEARWLFDINVDSISVWIHPQSIVHSMVEFIDGSMISQLSIPDMKIPIAYALSYPNRLPLNKSDAKPVDYSLLSFEEVDLSKFRGLGLAFYAIKEGGTMPAVLNAANEIAVNEFLNKKIKYTDIVRIIEKVMEHHKREEMFSIEDSLVADRWARSEAKSIIN
jgi:1-deoxy-D-xylulose-5-phosphate reductoisomerase